MQDEKNIPSIFISYAWGGPLATKEWIRNSIVRGLEWKHKIFWDRDSIPFGKSIDDAIVIALSIRPIIVFCVCDGDYVSAAKRVGSGLNREIQMLEEVAGTEGVSIIPLIFDEKSKAKLPSPLTGRAYLDLQPLHDRNLQLDTVLFSVADGATQAQVYDLIRGQLSVHELRERAGNYFNQEKIELWGNPRTHIVNVRSNGSHESLLLPPQWMWDSDEWGEMLWHENSTYSPKNGRWHWDYFTPSRGMRALGTAAMAVFFPHCHSFDDQWALEVGGTIVAKHVCAMTYQTEVFLLGADELTNLLINDAGGFKALEHLLASATPSLRDIS